MSVPCPSCGAAAEGRFCPQCGAAVQAADCGSCGNPLPPGARFCNMCGRSIAGGETPAARGGAGLPWFVAGVAVAALAGVIAFQQFGGDEAAAGAAAPFAATASGAGGAAPAGDARSVDLASMTPRQAADRLFNRVMQAATNGDTAQVKMFLPMSIDAYGRAGELDLDGRYHLGSLHLLAGDAAAARAEADAILAAEPRHLMGLFIAGQAEDLRGDRTAARALYARVLAAYDAESKRDLTEYRDHAQALPEIRAASERASQ
jgi:hypothetical protein